MFWASIEDDDLNNFTAAGRIEAPSIAEITERQIQLSVQESGKRVVNEGQLYLTDLSVETGAIKMYMVEAEDRDW